MSGMGLNEAAVAALRFVAELGVHQHPGVARLKSTDRGSWISDNAEHDLETSTDRHGNFPQSFHPFWRGETGAAWKFHGSDGSVGAPWLSNHRCLGVVTPVASWCSMVQRVLHGATVRQRDVGFAFCALRVTQVTCGVVRDV